MPTCPGCEQSLSHGRLDVHQRYCPEIWGDDRRGGRALERLDCRLAALERRLDRRLRHLEADLEADLSDPDTTGARGPSPKP